MSVRTVIMFTENSSGENYICSDEYRELVVLFMCLGGKVNILSTCLFGEVKG